MLPRLGELEEGQRHARVCRHEGSQVPGHGTVRPRRIRAITGELRAMTRMQASL
jgi:hypothetical protein